MSLFLLSLPLGVPCARPLEGGLEAIFVVAHPKLMLSLFGSFGTGFFDDGNTQALPVPNSLGISRR